MTRLAKLRDDNAPSGPGSPGSPRLFSKWGTSNFPARGHRDQESQATSKPGQVAVHETHRERGTTISHGAAWRRKQACWHTHTTVERMGRTFAKMATVM